ncbi:MAG TPA: hypothetical protein ENI23_09205 [bacterium]|nr:hypothetical protein [bacterium]
MAISDKQITLILDSLSRNLLTIANSGDDKLAIEAVDIMDAGWNKLNESLSPTWIKKQESMENREKLRKARTEFNKKILEDEKDV